MKLTFSYANVYTYVDIYNSTYTCTEMVWWNPFVHLTLIELALNSVYKAHDHELFCVIPFICTLETILLTGQ